VDVAAFVERLASGGHARAAGAKVGGTIEDAREPIVTALAESLRLSI
jgi:nanoRNase/pAp phosphatase (c-di-AMP/oligoRNAs hydrolase)